MKVRTLIASLSILASALTVAQNVREEPESDPVLDAIQKFKNRDKGASNEVTVVLDDLVPDELAKKHKEAADKGEAGAPVFVTGKPPGESDETTAPDEEVISDQVTPEEPATPEEEPKKPENGLAVRVESLQTGTGVIDPSKVKLLAPFPAKPLALPPVGWHLDATENAPPFTREVEISPGSKITLTIRPHLLVPDVDGVESFSIPEPGYESSNGYQQTETVGAILSTSIRQLDEDSLQLGNAIDRLQQLLVSLPAPQVHEETAPAPAPARKK
jgi:hypothetical protein